MVRYEILMLTVPEITQAFIVEFVQFDIINKKLTRIGPVQSAQYVQQRTFASSGSTYNSYYLAALYFKVNTL